jgi:hypothetical protein
MNVNYFNSLKPIQLFNKFETVVFGGAVRDILINSNLTSDIDIVADINNEILYDLLISTFGNIINKNKYDGYRFIFENHSYDIWSLELTYAYKKNYVKIKTIKNLINTTFFSWDSVLYHCNEKQIITIPDYHQYIRNKKIVINPIGDFQQTIKALKGLYKYRKYIDNDFITCVYDYENIKFSIKLFKDTCELLYHDKHYSNIDIRDIQNILLII